MIKVSEKQVARITRRTKAMVAEITIRYGSTKWDNPEKFRAEIFAGVSRILTEEGILK